MLESYEKYRSWFTTGAKGFHPDKGLITLLSKGMKAWMVTEPDNSYTQPDAITIEQNRPVISSNELVNLLATVLGGG